MSHFMHYEKYTNKKLMKTKISFFCILLLIPSFLFAQKGYLDKINQFDAEGQKEGYWIEDRGFDTIELYYKSGKKSGVCKSFSKRGILSTFGEYFEGKIAGTWYYFGDKGHLLCIQKDFMVNKDIITLDSGKKHIYPNKCYTIQYHPNGIIKEEGILLWNDDPEMDDTQEYGEWKYYDETGKLARTKLFK